MGQNKAQKQAAERAKKSTTITEVQPVAEQPTTPAPTATAAPAQPNKQTATIEKLKEGWTAKGVDLSKLKITDDGKFKLLVVAEGWPTCQIGPTGGITVKELKSYSKAFDAAMDGLRLYQKQLAREQKKAAVAAPPAPKPPASVTA
jgi:hypothetical protein